MDSKTRVATPSSSHRSKDLLGLVGNTPMIRIERIWPFTGVELHAKLEYFNPGGSIKDRVALHMIRKAEERGDLHPGGTVVEATSGNTGIGVAMVASVKGYKCVIVMSDKQSREKRDQIRSFGAEVVITSHKVQADSPDSIYNTARRIASETPGAVYLNQYDNPDNSEAHYLSTGPEIWEQMEGRIDAFVAGIGTAGTICGVGQYLKEKDPNVKVIAVDPQGSIFSALLKGEEPGEARHYELEGIGADRPVLNLRAEYIDEVFTVGDREAFLKTRQLAREEGIFAGGSSGAALVACEKIAARIHAGRIVTIFPDSGYRYLTKLHSHEWMKQQGFVD